MNYNDFYEIDDDLDKDKAKKSKLINEFENEEKFSNYQSLNTNYNFNEDNRNKENGNQEDKHNKYMDYVLMNKLIEEQKRRKTIKLIIILIVLSNVLAFAGYLIFSFLTYELI